MTPLRPRRHVNSPRTVLLIDARAAVMFTMPRPFVCLLFLPLCRRFSLVLERFPRPCSFRRSISASNEHANRKATAGGTRVRRIRCKMNALGFRSGVFAIPKGTRRYGIWGLKLFRRAWNSRCRISRRWFNKFKVESRRFLKTRRSEWS